jgi:hypothetical protein
LVGAEVCNGSITVSEVPWASIVVTGNAGPAEKGKSHAIV